MIMMIMCQKLYLYKSKSVRSMSWSMSHISLYFKISMCCRSSLWVFPDYDDDDDDYDDGDNDDDNDDNDDDD
jgi:hypothetical protein